jgi:hypothetical protein
MRNSGVSAGLYDTDSADHCKVIGELLRAEMFVVEDEKQAEKILSIQDKLPCLRRIIQWSSKSSLRISHGVIKVRFCHI